MTALNGLIYSLPKQVRKELFARAAGRRTPDYKGLERWLAANGYVVSSSAIHRSLTEFYDIARYLRRAEYLHCALGDEVPFESALQHVVLMDIGTALVRLADSKATRSKRAR